MSTLTFAFTNTHGPRYLWDHRNSSLTDFLINEYILGKNGMASPYVDGFYIGSCAHELVMCAMQDMGRRRKAGSGPSKGFRAIEAVKCA
jgi:hypothetical protein